LLNNPFSLSWSVFRGHDSTSSDQRGRQTEDERHRSVLWRHYLVVVTGQHRRWPLT